MAAKRIPKFIGWPKRLSHDGTALLIRFLGRIAAAGLIIIFTGAMVVHLPDEWSMNWFGTKSGEGIEYFIMLLSLLLIVTVSGSAALSIDVWLTSMM